MPEPRSGHRFAHNPIVASVVPTELGGSLVKRLLLALVLLGIGAALAYLLFGTEEGRARLPGARKPEIDIRDTASEAVESGIASVDGAGNAIGIN